MTTQAQDINSEEEARLEMLIQAQLSGRVRGFRVVRRDNGFVLQGRTPTYYAKQLVLHAAMQATALPILANEIQVCYTREERRTCCEKNHEEIRAMFTRTPKKGETPDLVRLATAINPFEAHIWQQALEEEGIRCQVLCDYLDAGVGDIPGIAAEVWVEAADLDRAEAILRRHQDHSEDSAHSEEAL
jgi:Putative prokaryotic signal transducing protein